MEPGFYVCRDCGRSWERMEFKLRPNPPLKCPHCDSTHQAMDMVKEAAYTKEVYGPVARALKGDE